jgi:hypothetical protein
MKDDDLLWRERITREFPNEQREESTASFSTVSYRISHQLWPAAKAAVQRAISLRHRVNPYFGLIAMGLAAKSPAVASSSWREAYWRLRKRSSTVSYRISHELWPAAKAAAKRAISIHNRIYPYFGLMALVVVAFGPPLVLFCSPRPPPVMTAAYQKSVTAACRNQKYAYAYQDICAAVLRIAAATAAPVDNPFPWYTVACVVAPLIIGYAALNTIATRCLPPGNRLDRTLTWLTRPAFILPNVALRTIPIAVKIIASFTFRTTRQAINLITRPGVVATLHNLRL